MDNISIYSSILNQSLQTNKVILFVPLNRMNLLLSSLLYKENLIFSYQVNYYINKIKIHLNKLDNQFTFYRIRRISKPSRRIYIKIEELKRRAMKEGRFYILSTNIGLITSNEAIKKNISGEILMEIFF
jgi:small subunit ribosomal protein S8